MHIVFRKGMSIIIVLILILAFLSSSTALLINSKLPSTKEIKKINNNIREKINNTTTTITALKNLVLRKSTNSILQFYTNYNGIKKETRLKLFFETKIDIDGKNGNDIAVKYSILPGIVKPFSLSINFKLNIRQLYGFKNLDENAFFEGYTDVYFPGILIKSLSGTRIRFGYQSPNGEKIPNKFNVVFKLVPNILSIRKKVGFRFTINPGDISNKARLNVLSGIAEIDGETVISEVYTKTLYTPAVNAEISLLRSKKLGKSILELERIRSGNSQVDTYLAFVEGYNTTYGYIKNIPDHVTISYESGRNGFIEFETQGKPVEEIGVCDDFENPVNKAYFSNLFSTARIQWNRDRLLLLKKGKANLSIYTEGEGVSFNVHLENEENGSLNLSAISENAIIDVLMELDLSQGCFSVKQSEFNITFSLFGYGPNGGFIEGSFTLKKIEEKPFELFFNGYKEGNTEISLAGKAFEIYNLDVKMKISLPFFNGYFTISIDYLSKTKEGSITANLNIVKKEKNISGFCRFDIINGVQITNLYLKINNFIFLRENVDETASITRWYNFSINFTGVEWYDYGTWGYILIKSNSSGYFSFDTVYTNSKGEITGEIYGVIRLKTTNDVFNISWEIIDGNKTYYIDGSSVADLSNFHLWMKDKIEISIPYLSGSFAINTYNKSGEILLYFDSSSSFLDVNIERIDITDFFDITLKGGFSVNTVGSSLGTFGVAWNGTNKWYFDTDFGLNCEGLISITNFIFKISDDLLNISIGKLDIEGYLDFNLKTIDNKLKINANVGITNLNISDAFIKTGVHLYPSDFIGFSIDLDITFNGNGFLDLTIYNETIILDVAIYDSSNIMLNSLWALLPGFIEINLENLYIGGSTTLLFNFNSSSNIPFRVQLTTDSEITADTIYVGMTSFLQIFVRDFVGDTNNGWIAFGFNTVTGKPIIEIEKSIIEIGVLNIVVSGNLLPKITNIKLEGSAYLEVFLDLEAFTWVYLKGTIFENTIISLEDITISLLLEPGKLDLLLENNLMNFKDEGNLYVYIFGYSSGWITIKEGDSDLIKVMGIVDIWLDMHFLEDGTISAVFNAKEVTGIILVKDAIRAAGELNGLVQFSAYIDKTGDTITISDLSLNITGEINGVIQAKTDETNWIPIFPSTTTGQIILITPDLTIINKRVKTTKEEANVTMEAWYTPPFSLTPIDVSPYTYTISFDDGSPNYEITTSDTEIHVTHKYSIGDYDPNIIVTTSNPDIDPVSDTMHVEIIHGNYISIVANGPDEILFDYVENDGKIHTWFTIKNMADENYNLEWEAYVDDPPNDESKYYIKPSSGVLKPGETKQINISFFPPPDNEKEEIYFIVNNTNYQEYNTYGESDKEEFKVILVQRFSSIQLWPLGNIYLPDLELGTSITASFWIWNIPDIEGPLNWAIDDYPENGTWSFSKTSGSIPDMGAEIIHFTVTAPHINGKNLGGEIKIISTDDAADYAELTVVLKTKDGSEGPGNDNVTINEDENGNISIAIGGKNEVHLNNFEFEINGIPGELNGDFYFDTGTSYVYINFSKNDLINLSVDGNAEFSIENFKYVYGDNIFIEISRVITGGFNCTQGKSGSFYVAVDDTYTDINIELHLNYEFQNFILNGNFDIDVDATTNGTLWFQWDLNNEEDKDLTIDGDLLRYSNMDVSITDFNFTMNNFSFKADQIHFNKTVNLNWNETGVHIQSGKTISASNIQFTLNANLSFMLTSGNIEIYGSLGLQFTFDETGFCLHFFAPDCFYMNGIVHIYFEEFYTSGTIFFTICGEFTICGSFS